MSPGSRRQVVLDAATAGFVEALARVAPELERILAAREERQAAQIDRALVRDLKRAFRDFFSMRPEFSLLPLSEKGSEVADNDLERGGTGSTITEHVAAAQPVADIFTPQVEEPGPLYAVAITPTPIRVERFGSRRVHARPVDRDGRAISKGVRYEWALDPDTGELGNVSATSAAVTIEAGMAVSVGNLSVIATQHGHIARAERLVEIVEAIEPVRQSAGIPTPEFLHEPGGTSRSRMINGRWQVNAGHRDFREIAERPALKLRYVAMLFAKEIVVRNQSDPRLTEPLEQMAEIAAYADRKTAPRRSGGRKKPTS